jgi:hypothetical protein
MGDEVQEGKEMGDTTATGTGMRGTPSEVPHTIGSDEMNPEEPWILCDPESSGIVRYFRHRRAIEGQTQQP